MQKIQFVYNPNILFIFSLLALIMILYVSQKAFGFSQNINSSIDTKIVNNSISINQLKNYALNLINQDRDKFGASAVVLSNNSAAQVQANELLKKEFISHWTPEGYKPYMLYSLYNGTGYVQQNIGQISYVDIKKSQNNITSSEYCTKYHTIRCNPIDPYDAIKRLEQSMMYNDTKCCNDGHRWNILDLFHTHVSIGIAYNKYYFVMVQNFENRYLDQNYKVIEDNGQIELEGKLTDKKIIPFKIDHIAFFSDALPTKIEFEENKDKFHYELGDLKFVIAKPLPSFEKYIQQSSYRVLEAKKWDMNNNNIDLEFAIPNPVNFKNKALTMVLYAKNENNAKLIENDDTENLHEDFIPMTSYTFFNY